MQIKLSNGNWATKQIALNQVDARGTQVVELFFGLDTLSGRYGAGTLSQSQR